MLLCALMVSGGGFMKPRLLIGTVVSLVISAAGLWAQVDLPDRPFLALTGGLLIDGTGRVIRNELEPAVGPTARFGALRPY